MVAWGVFVFVTILAKLALKGRSIPMGKSRHLTSKCDSNAKVLYSSSRYSATQRC
jgi:hypothetical protein